MQINHMPKVLLIDDDTHFTKVLEEALRANDYNVLVAHNEFEGMSLFSSYNPDLAIIDIFLPEPRGVEIAKKIREKSDRPIIMLSAAQQEKWIVESLSAGADDFVTKPFSLGILLARIKATLRRYRPLEHSGATVQSANLKIDFERNIVSLDDREVKLTSTEFQLLKFMVQNPDSILTHRDILKNVWGSNATHRPEYLRVYINHLRKKIDFNDKQPFITTEPGIGYRFNQYETAFQEITQSL